MRFFALIIVTSLLALKSFAQYTPPSIELEAGTVFDIRPNARVVYIQGGNLYHHRSELAQDQSVCQLHFDESYPFYTQIGFRPIRLIQTGMPSVMPSIRTGQYETYISYRAQEVERKFILACSFVSDTRELEYLNEVLAVFHGNQDNGGQVIDSNRFAPLRRRSASRCSKCVQPEASAER